MRHSRFDLALGLTVLGGVAWFVGARTGVSNVLVSLLYWAIGGAVIFLWNGRTALGRIIAAMLIPAILLELCLPKSLRTAVNGLPRPRGAPN